MPYQAMLARASRGVIAAVFAWAAYRKARDLPSTEQSLEEFGVPRRFVRLGARLLPSTEFLTAGALLLPATALAGALSAMLGLLVFTAATTYQLLRGRRPRCSCFGTSSTHAIGWANVTRNALLMTMAVLSLPQRQFDAGRAMFNSSVFSPVKRQVSKRDAIIWLVLAIHTAAIARIVTLFGQIVRQNAARDDGAPVIPVGAEAPDFSLVPLGASGEQRMSLANLHGSHRLLVAFTSSECAYCSEVYDSLDNARGNAAMAVIIGGDLARAEAIRRQYPHLTFLFDAEQSAATAYGVSAFPAAVVIEPEGQIAVEPKIGVDLVKELVQEQTLLEA